MRASVRSRLVALFALGVLAVCGIAAAHHIQSARRESARQAAIDRQLDRLAAPARRSTPISLRPDRP